MNTNHRAGLAIAGLATSLLGDRSLPPEAVDMIFERFDQADTSRSRETGTGGPGLSIVRALAEAQGGRSGAANRPEGGARLRVELPAAPRT